jgi:N-acetyl-gamma-glutamyl-phosphate reductase
MNTIKVGVFGATGYTGWALIKSLQKHPHVSIAAVTSESMAGESFSSAYPMAPDYPLVSSADVDLTQLDCVFLCLPHTQSAQIAAQAHKAGVKVIDLSADLRLNAPQDYQTWYHVPHPAPELLPVVYGLPEFYREQIAGEKMIANPGCYATTMLLGLLPLAQDGLIADHASIIVDAKSGTSGAGRKPKQNTLFSEVHSNFSPYNIGRAHRHIGEVEQQLASAGLHRQQLIFSPHLLPVARGILSAIYVSVTNIDQAVATFKNTYQNEALVTVLPDGELATLAHVVHTPHAVLSLTPTVNNTLVVMVAIDNLLKGAATQAVQNFNLIYGLKETCGLLSSNGGCL